MILAGLVILIAVLMVPAAARLRAMLPVPGGRHSGGPPPPRAQER
jgi:hypothetical protein